MGKKGGDSRRRMLLEEDKRRLNRLMVQTTHPPKSAGTMRSAVLSTLALMCTLAVCAEITPMADFSLEKVTGKWFVIGFASNAQWFVNKKDSMKMGTAMIAPAEDGDVDFSFATLNATGSCWRMSQHVNKTSTPGRLTFYSPVWENDNDMIFVDVVYDSYAVIHTIKTKEGNSHILNNLYSRTPELSAELLQKFKEFSVGTGVNAENILILPKNDECPEPEA